MSRILLLPLLAALMAAATGVAREREVRVWNGTVTFVVPDDWHVLREEADGDVGRYVYHVRNPASDSGKGRTNVIVVPTARRVHGDFKAFTDSVFAGMSEGVLAVLDDRMVSADRRVYFWRGQIGKLPYVGFDNFARSGEHWVHVRIVSVLVEETSTEWSEALSRDTKRLLASLVVNGRKVMDDDTGYPALMRAP